MQQSPGPVPIPGRVWAGWSCLGGGVGRCWWCRSLQGWAPHPLPCVCEEDRVWVMLFRVSWGTRLGALGSFPREQERREQAGSGRSWFPREGNTDQGKLRHPPCGSSPCGAPPLAPARGLSAGGRQRSRTSRRLPAHLGSAGGCRGPVLLPTPFPGSKSKSLFLRSSGCRPAVRQPDGKGTGALLPSLLAPCRRPLQSSRSPPGAVPGTRVDGARGCSWAAPRVADGSPQVPSPNLQLLRAQGRIAKSPEPAVPGWLCPVPL